MTPALLPPRALAEEPKMTADHPWRTTSSLPDHLAFALLNHGHPRKLFDSPQSLASDSAARLVKTFKCEVLRKE